MTGAAAPLRVLDLFAGLEGWGAPWRARGHDVVTVDYDPDFRTTIVADLGDVPAFLAELRRVKGHDWRPDVILASPPCEAFSTMTIGRNWTRTADGRPWPKTDRARLALHLVASTRRILEALGPTFFVIENPRAMLRKVPELGDLERRTVAYCAFGEPVQKPTDLWGGFPPSLVLPGVCKPKAGCHVSAPRGSRTGTQGVGRDTAGRPVGEDTNKPRTWAAHQAAKRYGTWNKKRLAALRAVVPPRLSLAVAEAAERDIASGLGAHRATLGLWADAPLLTLTG